MKRPPKQQRNLCGEARKPTKWSAKDLLQIWGTIAVIFGIVGGSLAYRISIEKEAFMKSLTSTIDGWHKTYHLNDEQARRILEIELDFHGTGNPLNRPSHTRAQATAHHAAMAAVMNTEDGKRFFEDQEGGTPAR